MAQPRFLNLDEQAKELSLTTPIIADSAITGIKIAPGSVDGTHLSATGLVDDLTLEISSNQMRVKAGGINQTHISLTGDLSFSNNQALDFRVENVGSDPTAGNAGRIVYRTDLQQLRLDDGSSFVSVGTGGGGGHTIEDEGTPLTQRAVLNFVGSGVTVTDTGSKTEVSIPGGGTGSTFAKDLFTVVNPLDKTLVLSNTPASNSETVIWNGLVLRPGASNDYTISGNTITLNAGITLTVGDELEVIYAF